jgi:signal transduction histidine kinase
LKEKRAAELIIANKELAYQNELKEKRAIDLVIINKELQQLIQLNKDKNKFFNIIAHDLKSPFNSIVGFSKLLVEQVRKKDYNGIEKYAGIIEQSSNRAMDLLMNLMEWARSQTGRMEFNPEYCEMVRLINETIVLYDDIAGQKKISINTNILPANAVIFADKTMITTVLRNLISNAVKFTHSGGKITISAQENQNELKISVSDNGVGISKANIQKIFRIEENYTTSGTNKEKGTGLGLILCKEFVEKHEGNIWAESEEGKGLTIYFTLPKEAETKGKNEN